MSQDGLYDWIADQDCMPREEEQRSCAWLDTLMERLQVTPEGDLLHAALAEEWNRRLLNLKSLRVE